MWFLCNVAASKEQKLYDTRRNRVAWLLFRLCTLWRILWHLLQCPRTEKWNYAFRTIKIQRVHWSTFLGMKKEKQVRWGDLVCIWRHMCMCVSFNNHGQRPFKMRTKLRLYCINAIIWSRKILTKIKLDHITYETINKASLPTSHCDPLKPAEHSHFSELALQVLLFSHATQLQLNG